MGVDGGVPFDLQIFIDFADVPAEFFPVVFLLFEGFAAQLNRPVADGVVLLLQLLLEDAADLFEFLPIVDAVVFERGEVDAGVVEGHGRYAGVFGTHLFELSNITYQGSPAVFGG